MYEKKVLLNKNVSHVYLGISLFSEKAGTNFFREVLIKSFFIFAFLKLKSWSY
jgi:hypothetical protein